MKQYISTVLFVIAFGAVCQTLAELHQRITFYSGLNGTGTLVGFDSKQADLNNWEFFLIEAKSYCSTGWWKLHKFENYTPSTEGENYWISAWNESSCRNVSHTNILKYHGSIRHFGPVDLDTISISIYSNTSHNGEEIVVERPATADIPFKIESIFTTGLSNWTFYTGDFEGNSTCLTSTESIHEVQYVTDENIRSARSIIKGCDLRASRYLML